MFTLFASDMWSFGLEHPAQSHPSQLISILLLKQLTLRWPPCLTATKPLPHKQAACVHQLLHQLQCFANQPSFVVLFLRRPVCAISVPPLRRTPEITGDSEAANCRAAVSKQFCCYCTTFTRQQITFHLSWNAQRPVLQAIRKWTEARSHTHFQFPALPQQGSLHSFSVFKLRCRLPLSDHRLQLLHSFHQFC